MKVFSVSALSVCLLPLVGAGPAPGLEDYGIVRPAPRVHHSKPAKTLARANSSIEQEAEDRVLHNEGELVDVTEAVAEAVAEVITAFNRLFESSTTTYHGLADEAEPLLREHSTPSSVESLGGTDTHDKGPVDPHVDTEE